jgi:hypothetical protein
MHPNPILTKFKEIKGSHTFKSLIEIADHPVPSNDRGNPMCLLFYVLGMCNSRCGRAKDHNDVIPGGKCHTKECNDCKIKSCCQVNILPK